MRIPNNWFNGPVVVETPLSPGPYGERFAPPQTIARAMTEDGVQMVRGPDGQQTASNTQVLIDPQHVIPAGTRVTVWPGTAHERVGKLITVKRAVARGLMSHQVLYVE